MLFFNHHSEAVRLPYYTIDEFSCASKSLLNSFIILQINIRSMNKNFEKLQEYLNVVKGKFSIIALTETWCNDDRADKNSVWQISNYTPIHQIRQTGQKGGGIALFVHNNFDFKIIKRGNICDDDIEYLMVEILRNKDKNFSCIYRPPRVKSQFFLDNIKVLNKFKGQIFLAGDFDINSLDYSRNRIVHDFFNCAFQNGIFLAIYGPTRVTKNSATIIDHILINTITDSPLDSGIVKTDISDRFAVF